MPNDCKLFVNLAVADLARAVAFFRALGFELDEDLTGDETACVVIADSARVMLLPRDQFARFTPRAVVEAGRQTEAILAVQVDDEDEVDRITGVALAAGASPANEPLDDDAMYGRSFFDPDGHLWEVFWLAPDDAPDAA